MTSMEEPPTRLTPGSNAWRSKLGKTPGSISRAKYHMRRNKTPSGNTGISGTTTTSASLAHEALLTNLNSALKALGGTPLNARSSNRFITDIEEDVVSSRMLSPIQPMQSLEDEVQGSPSQGLSVLGSADKVMKMQQRHSQLVQQVAELERSVLEAESKRESLHNKLMKTESELQKLREEKKSVSDAVSTVSREYKSRQVDLETLVLEIKKKESDLVDLEARIRQATSSLDLLEESKLEQSDALEHLKDLVKSKKKKIKKLDGAIEDKNLGIQELESKEMKLQGDILEAVKKKDELLVLVAKSQRELQESEDTMKRLECLSSEGYVLVEDQSRKATLAQEKWEEAEQRLGEIESQLVEASARLEAKKAMIQELEDSWMNSIDDVNTTDDKREARNQVLLLRQLKETTAAMLEKREKLTQEVESLLKQKRVLEQNNTSKVDRLESYCESLERALEETTAEIERQNATNNDSSRICKVLRAQLHEKENQLVCALNDIDHSNEVLDIVQDRVKEIEKTRGDMIRDCRDEVLSPRDDDGQENIQRPDGHDDEYMTRLRRKDSLATRLRREKHNAIQRIQGINGQSDQIRSSLHASIRAKMYDTRHDVYKSIRSIY